MQNTSWQIQAQWAAFALFRFATSNAQKQSRARKIQSLPLLFSVCQHQRSVQLISHFENLLFNCVI